MNYVGRCPRCDTELEFQSVPSPRTHCSKCSAGLMAVVCGEEPGIGPIQLELSVMNQGTAEVPGDDRPKGLPVGLAWTLLFGLVVFSLAGILLGLPTVQSEDSLHAYSAKGLIIGGFLYLGLGLVGHKIRQQPVGARGYSCFRSVFCLVTAVIVMIAGQMLERSFHLLPGGPIPVIVYAVLSYVLTYGLAGWWLARHAPGAPMKHALVLALVCVTFGVLLAIVARMSLGSVMITGAAYALTLPGILLGAWIATATRKGPGELQGQ